MCSTRIPRVLAVEHPEIDFESPIVRRLGDCFRVAPRGIGAQCGFWVVSHPDERGRNGGGEDEARLMLSEELRLREEWRRQKLFILQKRNKLAKQKLKPRVDATRSFIHCLFISVPVRIITFLS